VRIQPCSLIKKPSLPPVRIDLLKQFSRYTMLEIFTVALFAVRYTSMLFCRPRRRPCGGPATSGATTVVR